MPQVIQIKAFYTSKRTSFFLSFYFFKAYFRIAQEDFKQPIKTLVPISVSELSNPNSGQNPKLLIKKSSVAYFLSSYLFVKLILQN